MKLATLALLATAAAQNPGRDQKVGEVCFADDSDRCVDKDDKMQPNLKCCHLRLSIATYSKNTVCVDTDKELVIMADGTGVGYSFNCDYVRPVDDGAIVRGVSATVAALSALYLSA